MIMFTRFVLSISMLLNAVLSTVHYVHGDYVKAVYSVLWAIFMQLLINNLGRNQDE